LVRPTTQAQLEKLGFEVVALDGYHASLIYNGQRTALRGDSAKELLDVAKGWVEHVVSTSD
jgi:hypothetical protein